MWRNKWLPKFALSAGTMLVLACAFSVLTLRFKLDPSWFLLVCILASIMYPVSLSMARTGMTFWKGYTAFLVILLLAQAIAHGIYFFKMNAIHHDEGEAGAVAFIYFLASLVTAVVLYPLGFWIPRWFGRR